MVCHCQDTFWHIDFFHLPDNICVWVIIPSKSKCRWSDLEETSVFYVHQQDKHPTTPQKYTELYRTKHTHIKKFLSIKINKGINKGLREFIDRVLKLSQDDFSTSKMWPSPPHLCPSSRKKCFSPDRTLIPFTLNPVSFGIIIWVIILHAGDLLKQHSHTRMHVHLRPSRQARLKLTSI